MTDSQLHVPLAEATPDGRARAAALRAASGTGWQPTGVVTYQSTGRLLVTGSEAAVDDAMAALAGQAGLSLTALVPGDADERPVLSGWLGRFELQGSGAGPQPRILRSGGTFSYAGRVPPGHARDRSSGTGRHHVNERQFK